MFIEELTGSVQLEDNQTEYKGKLNRNDVVGWLKSIAGFANATGGDMYLGNQQLPSIEDIKNRIIERASVIK